MEFELTLNPTLLGIFGLINLLSFFYVMVDKSKARNRHRRIPEVDFFLWGICFGSIGIFSGMYFFRHKTRKWYFVFGFSLLAVQNIITINFLSNYI